MAPVPEEEPKPSRLQDHRRGEPGSLGSFSAALSFLGRQDDTRVSRGLHRLGLSGSGSFHPANSKLSERIERHEWLPAAKLPTSNYLEYDWEFNGLGVW